MGAQWKHTGRLANASKRGALISKLVKEIIVASKTGEQPENNSRLRVALEAARKASVPRENIERALKKGSGLLSNTVQYEAVTYEGFTPHRVPLIVECLTENKNRTAADIRLLFRKGQLGAMGSVTWMFERRGVVEATHAANLDLEAEAIEVGAQSIEFLDIQKDPNQLCSARFICDAEDLDSVHKALVLRDWLISFSELSYLPQQNQAVFETLTQEQKKEVTEFLQTLQDHHDVHRLYVGI